MTYHIGNKTYSQEEFERYIEEEKQKQFNYLKKMIYSQRYTSVTDFFEITEEQFYKDIKTAYNIIDIYELFDPNEKYYKEFNKRQAIICNGYTSSTPAMESYYSEAIFKYKSRYYKAIMQDTN